jgi:hypothetical protein
MRVAAYICIWSDATNAIFEFLDRKPSAREVHMALNMKGIGRSKTAAERITEAVSSRYA